MNTAVRKPQVTQGQFFAWAQAKEERYAFDGFGPVAMRGGSSMNSLLCHQVHRALDRRLQDDAGMDWTGTARTAGDTLGTPEIGLAVLMVEFHAGPDLPDAGTPDA